MVPNYPCHCHHHYKSVLSIQLYYIWVPTIRTMSHAHHFFVVSYYTSNINIANKINYCSYVWIILFSMPVLGRGWRSVCLKLSSEAVRGGLLHLAEGVSNKKTGRKYPGGICETEKTCGFCRVLKFCSVDVLLHLPVRKHEDIYIWKHHLGSQDHILSEHLKYASLVQKDTALGPLVVPSCCTLDKITM